MVNATNQTITIQLEDPHSIALKDIQANIRLVFDIIDSKSKLKCYYEKGHWFHITNSFQGMFTSPYAGRVRLSLENASKYSKELFSWLTSKIPDQLQIPQELREEIERFWSEIIANDDLGDQLFVPLQSLRPKSDGIPAQLQNILELARQEGESIPQNAIESIEAALKAINGVNNSLTITNHNCLVLILDQYSTVKDERKVPPKEKEKEKDIKEIIDGLSERSRDWLEQFLNHLINNPELEGKLRKRLRGYLWKHVQHDYYHYLLFGQNGHRIVPFEWLQASWDYIQHFRCNFGFFVTEAMLYPKITIVGATDISVPVTEEEEYFLREYLPSWEPNPENKAKKPIIERLRVQSATELEEFLNRRIAQNERFGNDTAS